MTTIQPGDEVQYRATFLRSIGTFTGPLPFAKGVVRSLEPLGRGPNATVIARVRWNTTEAPNKVNVRNLMRVDEMEAD